MVVIFDTSMGDYIYYVQIYKPRDFVEEAHFELMPVQEAYELIKNGREVLFMDENGEEVRVRSITKEPYSGRIYDVTVDNHIILVRRIPPDLRTGRLERSGMPPKVPSAALLPRTSEATGADFAAVWSGNSYGGAEIDADGETALVGYWRFNNDSAVGEDYQTNETVVDYSSSGNNGTIRGSALKFDGSNDYVNCGSDASLNITDAFTSGERESPRTSVVG